MAAFRRALVTGGSRGIGQAVAQLLRERGVEVWTPERRELDLSDAASIDAFLAQHPDLPIDILVNNAGINVINPLEAIHSDDWQAMLQINLSAPLRLMQGCTGHMKRQNWGRIVNISSIFSEVSRPSRGAYSATKAGLNGLTRAVATELAPHNILVNALCPGYVETELTRANNPPDALDRIRDSIPMRRLAQPHEIAAWVVFLSSEDNSYMTGQVVFVDGGFTCQ